MNFIVKIKINILNCLSFNHLNKILTVLIIFLLKTSYYLFFLNTFSILFYDHVTNKHLTPILDIYRYNNFYVFCLYHSRIMVVMDVFWCRCGLSSGRFDDFMAEHLPPHFLGRSWMTQ